MALSFWERESFLSGIDVAVIGSGIVGLNAAWSLKRRQPALNVTVFERGFLPYGASTRNAGFACFGSVSELLDDLAGHSEDEVFGLVEKRWRGLALLRAKLGGSAIDFHECGGYEVFTPANQELYERCLDCLPRLNAAVDRMTGIPQTFR